MEYKVNQVVIDLEDNQEAIIWDLGYSDKLSDVIDGAWLDKGLMHYHWRLFKQIKPRVKVDIHRTPGGSGQQFGYETSYGGNVYAKATDENGKVWEWSWDHFSGEEGSKDIPDHVMKEINKAIKETGGIDYFNECYPDED